MGKLVCHPGAFTIVVREIGSLLKHGNNGVAGLIHRIAVDARLSLRCKFEYLFGRVDRGLVRGWRLHVPLRVTTRRARANVPLPLATGLTRKVQSRSCDVRRWLFAGKPSVDVAKL